ncbi:MAG: hypothetical protein ACTSWQ_08480 [Candidatus Thorarchaeota archaeon]
MIDLLEKLVEADFKDRFKPVSKGELRKRLGVENIEAVVGKYGGKVVDIRREDWAPGIWSWVVVVDFGREFDYDDEDDREFIWKAVENPFRTSEGSQPGYYELPSEEDGGVVIQVKGVGTPQRRRSGNEHPELKLFKNSAESLLYQKKFVAQLKGDAQLRELIRQKGTVDVEVLLYLKNNYYVETRRLGVPGFEVVRFINKAFGTSFNEFDCHMASI